MIRQSLLILFRLFLIGFLFPLCCCLFLFVLHFVFAACFWFFLLLGRVLLFLWRYLRVLFLVLPCVSRAFCFFFGLNSSRFVLFPLYGVFGDCIFSNFLSKVYTLRVLLVPSSGSLAVVFLRRWVVCFNLFNAANVHYCFVIVFNVVDGIAIDCIELR